MPITYNPIDEDPRPGNYYVSIINGSQQALALGPFPTHRQALDKVDTVKAHVLETYDHQGAWFWAYGTARTETYELPGVLNFILLPAGLV